MDCNWWIALIIFVVGLFYCYVKREFTYWKRKGVPQLPPKFPIGNFENLLTSKKSQGIQLKELYGKFKKAGVKYAGIYLFTAKFFVPIDPELVKEILIKDFSNFNGRGFYSNERDQPLSVNMFTVDGPKWKILRSKFTAAFTTGKIRTMFPIMVNCVKTLMDKAVSEAAKRKTPIDVKETVSKYTCDVIGTCAFGIDCESYRENNKFFEYTHACLEESTNFARFGFLNAFPKLGKLLRMGLFTDSILQYFADTIENAFEYRYKHDVKRDDFLQILKDIKDKRNGEDFDLSLEEIQAQCLLFYLAGFETSSTTMTYLLYEISRKQDIQNKLRKEIKQVSNRHGGITYDALNDMKYLNCVIDETLRAYPPLTVLNRTCAEDYKLSGGKVIIEKGTNILVPVLGLHTDSEYYPEPYNFDPERFNEENKHSIKSATYLPFGIGPRNCIGMRFGQLQVKVGITHMLNKYKFTINEAMSGKELEYTTHFMLTPLKSVLLNVEEINE